MNTLHKASFIAVLLIGVSAHVSLAAVTVHANAGLGMPSLVTTSGAALPDGNQVQVGYFDAGFDVAANQTNLTALEGAWNLFKSATVTTILGSPGRLAEALTNTSPSFDGEQIYWWAFKTSDDSAPTAGLGNVLEHGIFSSTQSHWEFPVEGSAINSTVTGSGEVDIFLNAQLDGNNNLQLKAVPEPSAGIALALLGLLVGTRFRRRV